MVKYWYQLLEGRNELKRLQHCSSLDEREITEDTKLFFVGTTSSKYDLASQQFKSYKSLDRISVDSAAFGTSTWEYACSYAKMYSTQGDPGVVVAFQLKPGIEVFDLRDPNEYVRLGLPPEIAKIFEDAEPYFAINTNVPSYMKQGIPKEFVAAKAWIEYASGTSGQTGIKFLDRIRLIDDSLIPKNQDQLKDIWNTIYQNQIESIFRTLFNQEGWDLVKDQLVSKKFNDINELLALGAVRVYTPEIHDVNIQKSYLRAEFMKAHGLKPNTKVPDYLEDEWDKAQIKAGFPVSTAGKNKGYARITSPSAFNVIASNAYNRSHINKDILAQDFKYYFKGRAEPFIVPDISNAPNELKNLAHNLSLLYANAPRASRSEKIYIGGKSLQIVYGYIKLFETCKKKILDSELDMSEASKKFLTGIQRIEDKIRSKDDRKHVYIDILQYVFFSLIASDERFYGMTCPEIRGYALLHNFSGSNAKLDKQPYGYEKKINASTMQYDDMTVILCKSLDQIVEKTFGHVVNFIDQEDYAKKNGYKPSDSNVISNEDFTTFILPEVRKCKNIDQYQRVYENDMKPYLDFLHQ